LPLFLRQKSCFLNPFNPDTIPKGVEAMNLLLNLQAVTWQHLVMWFIGFLLIYLAIKKRMEPTLLLPMGFGAVMVNLPLSGAVTQWTVGNTAATPEQIASGIAEQEHGIIDILFSMGIANELFPLLLFVGIGAMIDFGPLLSNPKMLLFGAAAQFGIFFTLGMAVLLGFELKDAASIAIIGAADGPTSIFVANFYRSKYIGAIVVAAYSYMALVPIVQPPVIRLITTKKDRAIRMPYVATDVSQKVRILFPIIVTIIAGIAAPRSVALIGFLMFGNLVRECGVLGSLSQTAQEVLANLITLFLGLTVAAKMRAELFVTTETLMILGLGLVAFVFDTIGGVLFAKLLNVFSKKKINPMIGAAGISAFPMSARVIHRMGQQEDKQNFLLMHAVGANVSGQIASVIAGGMILSLIAR
jgi:oxaloacetate decarboxylase beta subunit